MATVDLNADLGEGYGRWTMGDDAGLLQVVSSANIACGFHAGDPMIMRTVCQQAADNGVAIGAHLGFRDLLGFGRRELPTPPEELHVEALYQLGALAAFAQRAGTRVSYVKPHGALYQVAARRSDVAEAIVEAMVVFDPDLTLLGFRGSQSETAAARAGLAFAVEGFADRAYGDDGGLLSRAEPGAVHDDVDQMVAQVHDIVINGSVETATGNRLEVDVDSICVHGDNPGALRTAQRIKKDLASVGVELKPFVTA